MQTPRSYCVNSEKHQKDRFTSVAFCLLGSVHVRADGPAGFEWPQAPKEQLAERELSFPSSHLEWLFYGDKGEAQKVSDGKNCNWDSVSQGANGSLM